MDENTAFDEKAAFQRLLQLDRRRARTKPRAGFKPEKVSLQDLKVYFLLKNGDWWSPAHHYPGWEWHGQLFLNSRQVHNPEYFDRAMAAFLEWGLIDQPTYAFARQLSKASRGEDHRRKQVREARKLLKDEGFDVSATRVRPRKKPKKSKKSKS